jgi:hypothetical protein
LGALRLFDIARETVEGYDALPLTKIEKDQTPGQIWQTIVKIYKPGEPMRVGFDRLIGLVPPGLKVNEELATNEQLSINRVKLFSLHVVALAVQQWEGEIG